MSSSNRPLRVLHVLTALSSGGAESFIMNMYRHMDPSQVQFDFLLRSEENLYKDELERMGSKVYITAPFPAHFLRNAFDTVRFFKNHHYDIIHVHANALLYMFALRCAKKYGVKCRIIHSHNSSMKFLPLLPIHNANKRIISSLATDYFACSDEAGKWMFPDKYTLVNNAISLDDFQFKKQIRHRIRTELGIRDNERVYGHVGRFAPQKNHDFLLDVFHELLKYQPQAKLILVGSGPLQPEIEKKAQSLAIDDRILFLGIKNNISDILNAFDVFLLPSLYEGLCIALIEAQANGLPIVCSDAISNQGIFCSSAHLLPLSKGANYWAEYIASNSFQRYNIIPVLQDAGFDIIQEAKKLQSFYLSQIS